MLKAAKKFIQDNNVVDKIVKTSVYGVGTFSLFKYVQVEKEFAEREKIDKARQIEVNKFWKEFEAKNPPKEISTPFIHKIKGGK